MVGTVSFLTCKHRYPCNMLSPLFQPHTNLFDWLKKCMGFREVLIGPVGDVYGNQVTSIRY